MAVAQSHFAARAVAPVVIESVGRRLHRGELPVLREAALLPVAAIDQAVPVSVGEVLWFRVHHDILTGTTSEPQAGHQYTPSGSRRISGWPHSQAWPPTASGRLVTPCRVSRSGPLRRPPHESQRAELCPKDRSSCASQKGQVRRCDLVANASSISCPLRLLGLTPRIILFKRGHNIPKMSDLFLANFK
jgi:hypothetical protein